MDKIRLMAHLVAGYTTDDISLCVARALVRGGAAMLEVQLAFSDPSADGPAIQGACTNVLQRGYRVSDGLALVARIRREMCGIPVYIMSYASLVYTPGVETFCHMASKAGATGLIIPDMPFDHDEGLRAACAKYGMEMVPVAAPSMASARLVALAGAGYAHIYAALRAGITGSQTVIRKDTLRFLSQVGANGSKVYGGFGITTGEQSRALAHSVDAVVAGSVFVRIISEDRANTDLLMRDIECKAREIVTASNTK